MSWEEDQTWESQWWGSCVNTYGEETKQLTYAHRMGIPMVPFADGHWPVYDLGGLSVLDIGGGPVSMLLKSVNVTTPTVADPCEYPPWIAERYRVAGIEYLLVPGEELAVVEPFDEAWIYNVLLHVKDPAAVIATARASARRVRIFEWIDTLPAPGHPHTLTAAALDEQLGGRGTIERMNENGCVGLAYYGTFPAELE